MNIYYICVYIERFVISLSLYIYVFEHTHTQELDIVKTEQNPIKLQ